MAYTPPIITPAGLTIPPYVDIHDYLIQQFLSIYGQASYLGIDSPDYQDIAIRALQAYDAAQAVQYVYLAMNPQTAIGAALDQIGRLIGTQRKKPSNSTALVTLTGTPGITVAGGVVRDVNNHYWDVATGTIGQGGNPDHTKVDVIATAQLLGTITANPGDIKYIATPTYGWTSVTNAAAAFPGQPVETDADYRARLLISQTKPSLSLRAGTAAAVAAVPGVTRSVTYENPTSVSAGWGVVDSLASGVVTLVLGFPFDHITQNGSDSHANIDGLDFPIANVASDNLMNVVGNPGNNTDVLYYIGDNIALGPPHSITVVAEGGVPKDIAQAIYDNRGIGCYTNGSTEVVVNDPSHPGISMTIRFYVLAYTPISVHLVVKPLQGYTSAVQNAIVKGVVDYLNLLGIGNTVVRSEIYGAALTARPDPEHPLFSIQDVEITRADDSPGGVSVDGDIPIAYNYAASGQASDVFITLLD
jgi:uncharacterized phage protein gp47/JayE